MCNTRVTSRVAPALRATRAEVYGIYADSLERLSLNVIDREHKRDLELSPAPLERSSADCDWCRPEAHSPSQARDAQAIGSRVGDNPQERAPFFVLVFVASREGSREGECLLSSIEGGNERRKRPHRRLLRSVLLVAMKPQVLLILGVVGIAGGGIGVHAAAINRQPHEVSLDAAAVKRSGDCV
eukprot:6060618-Pyramimonas_sp.AAC.2